MGIWQAYRALNSEQKRVLKTKQLTANRSIDAIIQFLQPLAAYDRVGDKARTRFGCGAGIGIVLAIVAGFMTGNRVFPGAIGVAILVVLVVVTLLLGYAWIWSRGVDLSNNLRQFMLPVLSLFREDIDPKQTVHLRADLGSPTAKEKLQKRMDPYSRGAYYKIVESFYIDPWATAEMPLADGSMLRWSITDHIRERKLSKRNPRGKIKMKTKYTVKSSVDVELTLRSDSYAVSAAEGERVKAGDKKKAVRIKARHKRDDLKPLDPMVFIDMVAGIYRRATPAQ